MIALVASGASAAPAMVIKVPVTLTNIDQEFDTAQVSCQLQWNEPFKGQQVSPTQFFASVKLVNRAYNGTMSVLVDDAASAQKATQAVCALSLLSSTDPTKGYRPGVDENIPGNAVPSAALPLKGAPLKTIVIIPLP